MLTYPFLSSNTSLEKQIIKVIHLFLGLLVYIVGLGRISTLTKINIFQVILFNVRIKVRKKNHWILDLQFSRHLQEHDSPRWGSNALGLLKEQEMNRLCTVLHFHLTEQCWQKAHMDTNTGSALPLYLCVHVNVHPSHACLCVCLYVPHICLYYTYTNVIHV